MRVSVRSWSVAISVNHDFEEKVKLRPPPSLRRRDELDILEMDGAENPRYSFQQFWSLQREDTPFLFHTLRA